MPARFRAVTVFEGLDTGDKRHINAGALSTRALPLTLLGMTRNPDGGWGHDGAEVVGRIDTLTRQDAAAMVDEATGQPWGPGVFAWIAEGEFDDRPEAADVEQLVRDKHLRGISVDLADVQSELEVLEEDEDGWPTDYIDRVTSGEIGAATVCAVPAFRGCTIELVEDTAPEDAPVIAQEEAALAASAATLPAFQIVNDGPGCGPCTSSVPDTTGALTASGGPLHPPAVWFSDPGLSGPTALQVNDDGRVFGHLATWGTCHVGFSGQCVTPPRSATGYALFHVGAVRCADGTDVSVGHLTLGTGHAELSAGAGAAAAHYDNTGTALVDVSAGEDAHGIWVAGALRPGASDEQVRTLRAAALSGDWRQQGRGLELVAALACNVPGFPVPRTKALAASGVPTALVAAGVHAQPTPTGPAPASLAASATSSGAAPSRAEALRVSQRIGQARARQTRTDRTLRWRAK